MDLTDLMDLTALMDLTDLMEIDSVSIRRNTESYVRVSHSLGVGLLQQSAPELVSGLRVHEDEFAVDRGQQVVDHHVNPLAVSPKVEVENAGVVLRLLRVPLLVFVVGDHLKPTTDY